MIRLAIFLLVPSMCFASNPCGSRVVVKSNVVKSNAVAYSNAAVTSAYQPVYQPVQYVYTVGQSVREQSYRAKLSQAEVRTARAEGIAQGMERALRAMQGQLQASSSASSASSIVQRKCGSCHSGESPAAGIVYGNGPYTWAEAGQAIQQIIDDSMPRPTEQEKSAGVDPKLTTEEKQGILKHLYDNIGE